MNIQKGHIPRICFVILHYNAVNETIKCIESVLRQIEMCKRAVIEIIVVDNGSLNESGRMLSEKYSHVDAVHILLETKNHGFARGNNIGFQYALEAVRADFIILSNNDIEIKQDNFFDEMLCVYEKSNFAVCGPDIYSPYRGIHQNPMREQAYKKKDVENLIARYRRNIRIFKWLKKTGTYTFFHKAKMAFFRGGKGERKTEEEKDHIVLHGAFLIFGPEYLIQYPQGLYPGTFMYFEEEFLYYLCQERKLRMLYTPELTVVHKEGAATRAETSSSLDVSARVDKALFEFERTIESAELFLSFMEQREKIIYACPWARNRAKSWSGTHWNLRQALGRRRVIIDLDTGFSDYRNALHILYKIIGRAGRISGTGSVFCAGLQEALTERAARRILQENSCPVLQFEAVPFIKDRRDQYLYLDLHYGYVKKMFEENPELFGISNYANLSKEWIAYQEQRQSSFMKGMAGVFVMGRWLKKELTERYGLPEEKVHHVGGGINLNPDLADAGGKGRNKILFVGRDYERKNGPLVVEAFLRLRRKRKDLELYIAGPKAQAYDGSGVHFLGEVPSERLPVYLNLCDIFCMPSLFEAYGMVFAEALAFGLPCIGRNAFEMPYFIEDGKTGYLLRRQSAGELAELMDRLLDNETVFKNVRDKREYYLEEYSWERVAQRIVRVMGRNRTER